MVKFTEDLHECEMITKIVDRADIKLFKPTMTTHNKMSTAMDISATNANGCPLDLAKLLTFGDFDFAHDVWGIRNHIDRTTGKLMDHFLPRCARGMK